MTYEFICSKCGKEDSIFTSINKITKMKLECCGVDMKRVFSPIPSHFKGSGFYKTDYKLQTEKIDGYCSSKVHKNTTPEQRKKILSED